MRVIIERDNGGTEVYNNITDLYVSYRQETIVAKENEAHPYVISGYRSHSWTSNLRELVKEIRQSLTELEVMLARQQNGGSS